MTYQGHPYPGAFFSYEGLDFSGKTTQAAKVIEKLKADGFHVMFCREPGGTRISERVRELLLDRKNLEMTNTAELMLFSSARGQLVEEVIIPALKRGEIVVLDRYCDSTTAYQGYGRGMNIADIQSINRIATQTVMPDLTFLIDISSEEMQARKASRGVALDRMESSGRAFYTRVIDGYREMARNEPERFVVLNGARSIEEIQEDIVLHTYNLIKKKLGFRKDLTGTTEHFMTLNKP